jgi:hypothetical protein
MGLRIREILIAIPNNRTKFSLHFRFLQALQGEHSFPLPDTFLYYIWCGSKFKQQSDLLQSPFQVQFFPF